MPRVCEHDVFEQTYLHKLKVLPTSYARFVTRSKTAPRSQDRAALDLGMHRTSPVSIGFGEPIDGCGAGPTA